MPISTETKLSIDFAYEWSASDGQVFEYKMKFMHGPMGPTIQIGTGEEIIELPAEMFTETADFLISQGVMRGKAPIHTLGKKGASISTTLAMPTLVKKGAFGTPKNPPIPQTPPGRQVVPFNSFAGEEAEEDAGEFSPEEQEAVLQAAKAKKDTLAGDRPAVSGKEGVSEEDAQKMARLRKEAAANTKQEEKKLNKRHRPKDEE